MSRIVRFGSMLTVFVWLAGPCRSAPDMEVRKLVLPDGRHLAFGTLGSGKDTVVVLHGGPGLQMQYLVAEWARLAGSRTLLFYDQRGRGLSDSMPEDSITMSRDADDLESLRQALALSRFSIAAHHSGATIASLYARRHPDRVQRLLLVSPSFARRSFYFWAATELNDTAATTRLTHAIQNRENVTDPAGFCRRYWGFWFSPVEVTDPVIVRRLAPVICDASSSRLMAVDRLNANVFRHSFELNLHDSLATVAVPALVMQGSGDEAASASAQTWAAWLPQGRELLVSGSRSPLFPWIGAESSFFAAADQFLSGGWPADAHQVTAPVESVTATSPVT
jgi:proline iminopeptidase